jgi:hypothetical protein
MNDLFIEKKGRPVRKKSDTSNANKKEKNTLNGK